MSSPQEPRGTILESDDEIRQAQEAIRGIQKDPEPSRKPARAFRPSERSPMALLIVCDDGQSTGEVHRIRSEEFVVGRTEGDLKLAFDGLLSKRHLAITCQMVKGHWRWAVTDLQSQNGLFFRVSSAVLDSGMEFLVGKGRYRYQRNPAQIPATDFGDLSPKQALTQAQQADEVPGAAFLSEVIRSQNGTRFPLVGNSYWIGSSSRCEICRTDDPYTDSSHAKLVRDEDLIWTINNNRSRNGVWVRLPQISIGRGGNCQFQAGEQRFILKFGGKA